MRIQGRLYLSFAAASDLESNRLDARQGRLSERLQEEVRQLEFFVFFATWAIEVFRFCIVSMDLIISDVSRYASFSD